MMINKLDLIQKRYAEINRLMSQPGITNDLKQLQKLGKENSELEEIVYIYDKYKDSSDQLEEMRKFLNETNDTDMKTLIKLEIEHLQQQQEEQLQRLSILLSPKDPHADKDVIVEIRAGTGGEEASLFAANLFRMYSRYAQSKNWKVNLLNSNPIGIGGFREVIFEVKGKGAFSQLKYEQGVHRVQRVPATEASGRIHTSTATVAVLPTVEEIELHISQDDIKLDFFHSGGAGGQNVNKDERSQLKNRMKAMAVLRARLYDQEQRKQSAEIDQQRRKQIGTGERAEKIRTYNIPQDRVTDHRINTTFHNLPQILDGDLSAIIDALLSQEQVKQLESILS
jgi:peptide chain release factor 1